MEDTKNGEFRTISVSNVLLGVLEKLGRNGDYVFSAHDGTAIRSIKIGFCAAIKRASTPHIRFHDLRHTFGSRAVMSGVDLATVKELMGHKRMAVEMLRSNIFGSKTGSFETSKEVEISEVRELSMAKVDLPEW